MSEMRFIRVFPNIRAINLQLAGGAECRQVQEGPAPRHLETGQGK